MPLAHGPPPREPHPSLLIQTGDDKEYRFRIRWYTVLDDNGCFARWLLIPTRAKG
jgi:hypothetical protein